MQAGDLGGGAAEFFSMPQLGSCLTLALIANGPVRLKGAAPSTYGVPAAKVSDAAGSAGSAASA